LPEMRICKRLFTLSGQLAVLLLVFVLFGISSCGKKGVLTLASREKPPAPSHLAARHREGVITLSWDFPAEKERELAGFIILRAVEGGVERIASPDSGSRSYGDTDFKEGTGYRYEVLARNLAGILSDASNVAALTPSPGPVPPREITSHIVDDSVLLSWEKAGDKILYNVYRAFSKGSYGPAPLNTSPLRDNTFHDALFIDRPVYYTIRSLSEDLDEGPPSAECALDPGRLVPPAPQDVRCFALPDRTYLYWKGPQAAWVTGFRIYRKIGSGEYTLIGETQIPSFVDMYNPSPKRDYRVTALGPSKEGPAAEIAGACRDSE
jgi:predicted small lipoprotein YifL